jgi:glycosyltransferase involved in cell wall biosynthesis
MAPDRRGVAGIDVSVVMSFADDEERVGRASRRIAEYLHELGCRFEIIAVDEDSRDNSVALLSLLRASAPELQIVVASREGRAYAAGARVARGRVLWLLDAAHADSPLAAFGWALRRVLADEADLIDVDRRFLVCRRTRVWALLDDARGRGDVFARRLVRRARSRRLKVEGLPAPASKTPQSGGRVPARPRVPPV